MTGSLFAPLSLASPVRPVVPNYSVDSFSEYSTRTVNRGICSPSSANSGPRSARAKEEDEELFRDLFAADNDGEASEEAPAECRPAWSAAPTFLPQKPLTQRAPSLNGNPNPRHLAPMKPAPPQPMLSTPFIPRLKLEELVNARPDDDGDDDNNSRRTSRRGSDLEQVTEEGEYFFDDEPNVAAPSKARVMTRDRGFNGSLRLISRSNQRSGNNDKLDQETLRFLETLDLKAVLRTPRPDILSFYPGMATTPTTQSMASPYSKTSGVPAKLPEDGLTKDFENDRAVLVRQKLDAGFGGSANTSRIDGPTSRLAYMESTYGTAPIVRKTRRETIDRLANPISGHSSTLQALSPRRRGKREALTSRAPLSPVSAAIAVSCRRGTTLKKGKTTTTPTGTATYTRNADIPALTVKRKASKRQDTLVQKRRSNTSLIPQARGQAPTISGLTKRKSKTTLGSRSLAARKEALKKKLQTRPGATKRGGDRKIGGSTFLTQRDDEEGVEDFIARHRGAVQTSLTFRSGNKIAPRMPALPSRKPSTARPRPQPPHARPGVPFARVSGASKGRGARELESLSNSTDRTHQRPRVSTYTVRSGADHERSKIYSQPRRPQAWQAAPAGGAPTCRSTTLGGVTNPLRKLKVHPAMPTLLPRAPKTPPSAATTLLMGSAPRFSLVRLTGSETKSARVPRRGSKNPSARKLDGAAPRTSFDAPTKISEQRKRTPTTSRSSGAGKASGTRHPTAVRRSTSRL
jgi:hypothetical protein